jgi:hypothetical protein
MVVAVKCKFIQQVENFSKQLDWLVKSLRKISRAFKELIWLIILFLVFLFEMNRVWAAIKPSHRTEPENIEQQHSGPRYTRISYPKKDCFKTASRSSLSFL